MRSVEVPAFDVIRNPPQAVPLMTKCEGLRSNRKDLINDKEDNMDNNNMVPQQEPDRQYYYMDEMKKLVLEKSREAGRTLTYNVTTFGCQMNAHDSEKLKGILEACGFEETGEEDGADFVLLNTCTIRENANTRLYGHLGQLKAIKRGRPDMVIALCGCMMQEPHVIEAIKNKYRHVDVVFGTFNIYKLAELLYKYYVNKERVIEVLETHAGAVETLPQKRKFGFKAGVNIMYGCNNFCTYCIVPYVRGRETSRTPEEIMNEVRLLVKSGVKEIMLLGQNVNSYGIAGGDIGGFTGMSFPELIKMVAEEPGVERLRFMTSHPKDLSDELIEVIRTHENICRHIHLPVQSGSNDVLKKMNRRYTKESYLALVDRIRKAVPDISLTTDIIVGFPGETEEDFLDTLDVVERVKYDQAFTFIYSKRTGTPAASFEDQVDEAVIKDRFDRLLDKVNTIAHREMKRFEGRVCDVLVEEKNRQEEGLVTGRTSENVTVHFKGDASIIGSTVKVLMKEAKGFYYMGEIKDE